MYLYGLQRWRPLKWQTMVTCGCAAEQVKVRVCELGLLLPWLNDIPSCDDSVSEGGMRSVALYETILRFIHLLPFSL